MIVYSHSFFAMYTRFTMLIPGMDDGSGEKLARGAEQRVEEWEQCLSSFRSGAELQLINELAANRVLKVSEPMGRVLDICDDYNSLTDGLFDPAVNQNRSKWTDLNWDSENRSIHFSSPDVKLDMGAIGKGIALDEVVDYLRAEGVSDAFLSFGESSIAGMGKHPHGDGWLVGSGDGFLLRDEFLSISGLQDLKEGRASESGAHIYHPRTGGLISHKHNVMVKCNSASEAEVLSTCAYLADEDEFGQLKRLFPEAQWKLA